MFSLKITLSLITLLLACAEQAFAPAAVQAMEMHSWEYRWGDSPAGGRGTPAWAEDDGDAGWLAAPSLDNPTGRGEHTMLWLRVRLPIAEVEEPSVFLANVQHAFEAYHRGKRVYSFGDIDPRAADYRGRPWHMVPLEPGYAGTRLYLRIHSFDRKIGVSGPVYFGSRTGHEYRIFRNDFWRMAVTLIFIVCGFFLLTIYMGRREEKPVLFLGIILLLMAAWNVGNSQVKLIYLNAPLAWLFIEHASLYFTPVAIGIFMELLFGRGPRSIIRRGWQALLAYAVVALTLSSFNLYWLRAYTLGPFRILFALYLVMIFLSILREAWRGDIDARITFASLTVTVSFALYDICVSHMGLSFKLGKISYWGLLAFTLAMGLVIDRRLRLAPAKILDFEGRFNGPPGGKVLEAERRRHQAAISAETRTKLDQAIDFIREHYTEDMSREGLAGLAGMNHDYFGKMFLIYTGKKVGIYIGELRVRKAADELALTRRSIVDIAFSSGFESLSTFYRIFQAVTGLSPSAYRNRFRKREPR